MNSITKLFKVHVLIDGVWTYPLCFKEEGQYYEMISKEMIDRVTVYNVESL